MPAVGWMHLLDGFPWYHGEGAYPLPAYSEFMPPPRFGRKPYGSFTGIPFDEADPWGVPVSEYEDAWELTPGLDRAAAEVVAALVNLGRGKRAHGIARHKLEGNPCWPPELAQKAGTLAHERYVLLMPLALARTQDEKGRVRWTLFGGSEQGPARPFVTGVEARVNSHGGDSSDGFALRNRPLNRCSATIFRQERSVQVDVAERRKIEHPLRNDAAVAHHDDGVRLESRKLSAEIGIVLDALRLDGRQS